MVTLHILTCSCVMCCWHGWPSSCGVLAVNLLATQSLISRRHRRRGVLAPTSLHDCSTKPARSAQRPLGHTHVVHWAIIHLTMHRTIGLSS